jgi:peptide deformylase
MAIREILTAPDPRLKQISEPVERVDDEVRTLMDDMLQTMYAAPGIGLAAIQVGVPKRVIVIDLAEKGAPPAPRYFVNPVIEWASETLATYEEGCLSVPDIYDDVARPDAVKIRYLDYDGGEKLLEATGLLATCLQHEIDHLNGQLFIDHLSKLKRAMALRKLAKARRQAERQSA